MLKKNLLIIFIITSSIVLLEIFNADIVFAQLSNSGVMNTVLEKYKSAASTWAGTMQEAASRLYINLAAISLVWTMGQLPFHRSSFAEFFGELLRYIIFIGFFYWLMINAPQFAETIINSLRMLGSQASGIPETLPSDIVDIGFNLFGRVCEEAKNINVNNFGSIFSALIFSAAILVILTLVAVNVLLQFCAAWILAYAGIFFLGFGATKWTSDIAINYFKTVLALGASLMTMTLLVGIGIDIIDENIKAMSTGTIRMFELGVVLVSVITLFLLVDKLPAMVAGIINGSSIGASTSIGAFGAGAAVGAAGVAMGAAKFGGAIIGGSAVSAVANAAGALTKAGDTALNAMQQGSGAFAGMDQRPGQGGLKQSMGITTAFATEAVKSLAKDAGRATGNTAMNAAQKIIGGK